MNKLELIELIKTLKVNKEEFWVLSSGALVLRGLWDNAKDLDIAVTNTGLAQLRENYELKPKKEGCNDWFRVNDIIECVCDGEKEDLDYQPEIVEGIQVQNIKQYLEFLEGSNREKDKARIQLVKEYIKSQEVDR